MLLLVGVTVAALLVLRVVFVAVFVLGERRRRPQLDAQRARMDKIETRVDSLDADGAESGETGTTRAGKRISMFRRRIARGRADFDFYEREPLTLRGGAVLSWAGMRGVVTLAAALSISEDVPSRTVLVCVAFGVAVVSLLLYGGTLPWVIRWLKLPAEDAGEQRSELRQLIEGLTDSTVAAVGPSDQLVIDGHPIDPEIVQQVNDRYRMVRDARFAPDGAEEELLSTRAQLTLVQRHYLDAMREALHEERAIGAYSTAAFTQAESMLDAMELQLDR